MGQFDSESMTKLREQNAEAERGHAQEATAVDGLAVLFRATLERIREVTDEPDFRQNLNESMGTPHVPLVTFDDEWFQAMLARMEQRHGYWPNSDVPAHDTRKDNNT